MTKQNELALSDEQLDTISGGCYYPRRDDSKKDYCKPDYYKPDYEHCDRDRKNDKHDHCGQRRSYCD